LSLALSRLGGLPVDDPVRVGEGLGEAPGCLVEVLGSSSAHHVSSLLPKRSRNEGMISLGRSPAPTSENPILEKFAEFPF
jgi:hypothetical protein